MNEHPMDDYLRSGREREHRLVVHARAPTRTVSEELAAEWLASRQAPRLTSPIHRAAAPDAGAPARVSGADFDGGARTPTPRAMSVDEAIRRAALPGWAPPPGWPQ